MERRREVKREAGDTRPFTGLGDRRFLRVVHWGVKNRILWVKIKRNRAVGRLDAAVGVGPDGIAGRT